MFQSVSLQGKPEIYLKLLWHIVVYTKSLFSMLPRLGLWNPPSSLIPQNQMTLLSKSSDLALESHDLVRSHSILNIGHISVLMARVVANILRVSRKTWQRRGKVSEGEVGGGYKILGRWATQKIFQIWKEDIVLDAMLWSSIHLLYLMTMISACLGQESMCQTATLAWCQVLLHGPFRVAACVASCVK